MKTFIKAMYGVCAVAAAFTFTSSYDTQAFAADEATKDGKHYVFIRPDTTEPHAFFDDFVAAMEASAASQGDELEVLVANEDHYLMLDFLREITQRADKPDAVVFMSMRNNGVHALEILEEGKVDSFIVNSGLTAEQRAEVGEPREKMTHWLGEMLPDDVGAGYALAKELYTQAIEANPALKESGVKLLAIEGNSGDGASVMRVKGLNKYAEEQKNLDVVQVLNGRWQRDTAEKLAKHSFRRHDQIDVIWTASDSMAIGAAEGVKGQRTVGEDIFIGGVDWSGEGLKAIEDGVISASAGGHILEGAWATIALHDYYHGHDFAESEGLKMNSPMYVANKDNLGQIKAKLGARDWDALDFQSFSKAANEGMETYSFSIIEVE